MDKLQEVYARYKHYDRLLNDPQMVDATIPLYIARDLWIAIKETVEK
jgi:hypothetical protein